MKAIHNSARKAYVQVISSLIDPFYSREIIFLFLVLMTTYLNFSNPYIHFKASDPIYIISSITFPIFIVLLLYSGVIAGNFGNFIGKGAQAFFFTTPVSRFKFYLILWLSTILFSFILFSSYLVFLTDILTYTVFSFPITILLLMVLSSLTLYTSVGMLISVLTRNAGISFGVLLALFFVLSLYSSRIFPNSIIGRSFVSGIRFMGEYPLRIGVAFWPSIILIILSVIIFILGYIISNLRDYRSGRSA